MLVKTKLQLNHRYFMSNGNFLYFGTILHDSIQFAPVNLYNYNFYAGHFTLTTDMNFTFYTYIPYKMEEIMLNKILKKLLGKEFFYELKPKMKQWYIWDLRKH